MMKWINNRGTIQVDAKTLFIEPLLRIYKDDKSSLKETANRYLAYIHLVSQVDFEAPYFKADYHDIRALVKKQLFADPDLEFPEEINNFLEATILEYQRAYEEAGARAARVFKKKIDNVIRKIDETDVQVTESVGRGGNVTYVSNFPILSKMMNEVGPLLDIQDNLELRVKKMNDKDVKVRGNKRQSILTKKLVADNQNRANDESQRQKEATDEP